MNEIIPSQPIGLPSPIMLPAPTTPITIRRATMDDLPFIDALQKLHSQQLGFLKWAALEQKVAKEKVLIDLGCSSHNAMWEKNHLLLFKATVEWLKQGKVEGASQGMLKLGY